MRVDSAHLLQSWFREIGSNRVWAQTCRCNCAHTHPQCVLCAMQKEMAGQLIGLRSTCISQVLGTDMKKHFEILSRFQVNFSHSHLPDLHSACLCCSSVVHTTRNGWLPMSMSVLQGMSTLIQSACCTPLCLSCVNVSVMPLATCNASDCLSC